MIPILKSTPQYLIQMEEDGPYPFHGLKPSRFKIFVKSTVSFNQFNDTHNIIQNIISIDHQHCIKINKVTQSHLYKTYLIVYEYVPYKLNYPALQIQQYIKSKKYKSELLDLFKQMLKKGIKPNIKYQNFGFTSDFQIKFYIKPISEKCVFDQSDIESIANLYICECEHLFDKQEFSSNIKIKNKLTDLSQKIKKLNQGFLLRDARKKQKKQSESGGGRNQSDNSDSLAKTNEQQNIGNAHWRFDHDFHFQDSYSQRDNKKIKKKRHSSFKDGEKTRSEIKQKKASWGEQRSSYVQSDKATVLKKRISQALLKTQKTLTKYQKIRNKSSKRRHQQSPTIPE